MKKIVVLILVLTILASGTAVVFAGSFVPSVSYEPYPGLVVLDVDDEGNEIVGYVEDAEGNVLSNEYHGCILITPNEDARKGESYLSDVDEELLVDTYDTLTADDARLSTLIPMLNEIAKEELGASATADDMVFLELIDIRPVCKDLIKYLEVEENTLTLKFKLDVPEEAYFNVMTLTNDEWEFVKEAKNNLDGTVSVKFSHFCPVLFIIGMPVENVAPAQNCGLFWLILLCAIILIISVIVFYVLRKKRKE